MCGNSPSRSAPEAYRYYSAWFALTSALPVLKYASAVDQYSPSSSRVAACTSPLPVFASTCAVSVRLLPERSFAVVLQTVCGVQETPPPPRIVPWLLQGSGTDIQRIPAHQGTTGTVVHATGRPASTFRLQMPAGGCPAVMVVAFPCNCPRF